MGGFHWISSKRYKTKATGCNVLWLFNMNSLYQSFGTTAYLDINASII